MLHSHKEDRTKSRIYLFVIRSTAPRSRLLQSILETSCSSSRTALPACATGVFGPCLANTHRAGRDSAGNVATWNDPDLCSFLGGLPGCDPGIHIQSFGGSGLVPLHHFAAPNSVRRVVPSRRSCFQNALIAGIFLSNEKPVDKRAEGWPRKQVALSKVWDRRNEQDDGLIRTVRLCAGIAGSRK